MYADVSEKAIYQLKEAVWKIQCARSLGLEGQFQPGKEISLWSLILQPSHDSFSRSICMQE